MITIDRLKTIKSGSSGTAPCIRVARYCHPYDSAGDVGWVVYHSILLIVSTVSADSVSLERLWAICRYMGYLYCLFHRLILSWQL